MHILILRYVKIMGASRVWVHCTLVPIVRVYFRTKCLYACGNFPVLYQATSLSLPLSFFCYFGAQSWKLTACARKMS